MLVVEDNEPVRGLVRTLLDELGYVPVAAAGPAEALTLAAEQAFDLVLTDVALPGMSGVALVERLRGERPDMRIVYMSGYASDDAAAALGDNALLLQKPFTADVLDRTLRRAFDGDGA